ncbi:MAG TPA: dolichyl-phosphate beta-glucosyltransferase, partial [Terriglobales bacterium]|nr:dolichyl-phosphate beta-glucosyltransferase [Terriglobales bacterium]
HPSSEVLVVDDGSTDATVAVTRQHVGDRANLKVLSYSPNRGKGYAVRYGLARAEGELVLFSDADLSTPIEEMEKMLAAIDQGYDIVIGSRAHQLAEIRKRQPLYRELAGKFFNLVVRGMVLPDLHDTQCGFKLFRRSAIEPVLGYLRNDGFAFDVEILALGRAKGLKILEVPVVWVNSPMSRVRLSAATRAYFDLLDIRRRAQQLAAGALPAATGVGLPQR